MLSENTCGFLLKRACLFALVVLAQRGEPTLVIPAPMVFLPRMHRSCRQQAHEPRAQQHPAVWFHRLDLAPDETQAQVAITSPDRAPARASLAGRLQRDGSRL